VRTPKFYDVKDSRLQIQFTEESNLNRQPRLRAVLRLPLPRPEAEKKAQLALGFHPPEVSPSESSLTRGPGPRGLPMAYDG
jgi:hypothetical protein